MLTSGRRSCSSATATTLDRLDREQEFHQQNERIDQFASEVNYDFRNTLNVATGRLDLVADKAARHLAEGGSSDVVTGEPTVRVWSRRPRTALGPVRNGS